MFEKIMLVNDNDVSYHVCNVNNPLYHVLLKCHNNRLAERMIAFKIPFSLKTTIFICFLLYLASVLVIIKMLQEQNCDNAINSQTSIQSDVLEDDNSIAVVVLEFEMFQHDLIGTINSYCLTRHSHLSL